MKYKQLNFEQRILISLLLKLGLSQTRIAKVIGVSKSTVSREIKRNTGLKGYRPKQADQRAVERKKNADKHIRFTDAVKTDVRKYLEMDWSPEQISGWLKKNNKAAVSHETIYQYILQDQNQGGSLYTHLRLGRKKRRKRIKTNDRRGQIPNRVSIDERPAVVDKKQRVGDWEVDTIIGKNHKGALLSAVERKTKFSCMSHIPQKKASFVTKALIEMLKPYKHLIHTLTTDNGKEFSEHEKIAKALKANFYFAHPYSSWERGLNENTNGLIRQYFPKKSPLEKVSKQQVLMVQEKLNERPRKLLKFETPKHLFLNSFVALET